GGAGAGGPRAASLTPSGASRGRGRARSSGACGPRKSRCSELGKAPRDERERLELVYALVERHRDARTPLRRHGGADGRVIPDDLLQRSDRLRFECDPILGLALRRAVDEPLAVVSQLHGCSRLTDEIQPEEVLEQDLHWRLGAGFRARQIGTQQTAELRRPERGTRRRHSASGRRTRLRKGLGEQCRPTVELVYWSGGSATKKRPQSRDDVFGVSPGKSRQRREAMSGAGDVVADFEPRDRDGEERQAPDGAVVPDDLFEASLANRYRHPVSDLATLGCVLSRVRGAHECEPAVVSAQLELYVERPTDVAQLPEMRRG